MRRLLALCALLLALLIPAESVAGPFMVLHKRGSAWSASYSAETLAYQTRVEADGGTVYSLDAVEAAYQLIAANSLSPALWVSARFGYKVSTGSLVKLYDISDNDNDVAGVSGKYPTWAEDQQNGLPCVVADGADKMTFSVVSMQTAFFAVKKAATTDKGVFVSYSGYNAHYYSAGSASSGDSSDFGNIHAGSDATAPTGNPQTFHIASWKHNINSPYDLTLGRDGSYGTPKNQNLGAGNNANMDTLVAYSTETYSLSGLLGEAIMFSSLLGAESVSAIDTYLSGVWIP